VLFGHREFVCLIGSDEGHAMDMLESIKLELDGNELLLADFPGVIYPIQRLDDIANRCSGQLLPGPAQSSRATVLMPSHGRFVGASSNPFSEYRRKSGDRVGLNGRIPNVHRKRAVRHVVFDTKWCKSFVHARLAVAMADRGCLSQFDDDPSRHCMLALDRCPH
jgi:hypothetical protein